MSDNTGIDYNWSISNKIHTGAGDEEYRKRYDAIDWHDSESKGVVIRPLKLRRSKRQV